MMAAQKVNPARENGAEVVYSAVKVPKALSKVWNRLKNYRNGIKRDDDGNYYRWDYTHGDIEMYDKKSKKEIGSLDPTTGEKYREGETGRKLDI